MTLKTIISGHMASSVFLNTGRFAQSVTFRPGVDASTVSAVFDEEDKPEERVDRAVIMTASADVTPKDGDEWLVGTDVWRTLHTVTEFGANTSYVHKRLPSIVAVLDRNWVKTQSGSHRQNPIPDSDKVRALIIDEFADIEFDQQHRRLDARWTIYLEGEPSIDRNSLIVNTLTGERYRVERYEKPLEVTSLARAYCELEGR